MTIEPLKEKLDDKIAKLNSSRVIKKITPRYDLSWYIKWFSSITLIIAMLLNANNIFPLNLYISVIGLIGWLVVSLLWKDRSLIVLNTVAVAIYLNGIVQHLWG
mgnify:CR=1 FL=1